MDDKYKEGDFMKKRVLTFILILSILFVAGIVIIDEQVWLLVKNANTELRG